MFLHVREFVVPFFLPILKDLVVLTADVSSATAVWAG